MIPLADFAVVVTLAAAAALMVAIAGAVVLRAVRRRSITTSITVAALVPVVAVAAGIVTSGAKMFISGHDLSVLLVVIVVAGAVALVTALLLGRAVVRGSHALGLAARTIGIEPRSDSGGADVAASPPVRAPPTAELAALARELQTTAVRLAESRARERALENSRAELIGWVSHDLRTPLAGVRAMAEALEDGVVDDPPTVARYHEQIRIESERLTAMVDDLFELSRIHAGTLRLTPQQVSLSDLVSDALASADPVASAKGVRLHGRVEDGVPLVSVSVPELSRVLRNLLSNAIRHTPYDGAVHVVGGADGSSAYVAVSDTCGGIPAEDIPRLFQVAFRGTAARTPAADGGGGLGLAIARGIVEAHAGEISVANEGAGCRFTLRLPVAGAGRPADAAAAATP